jgi:hypothetical protein
MSATWRSLRKERLAPLPKWRIFMLGFSTGVIFAVLTMYLVGSYAHATGTAKRILLCLV